MWSSGKTPASKVKDFTIKAGARERSGVRIPPSALFKSKIINNLNQRYCINCRMRVSICDLADSNLFNTSTVFSKSSSSSSMMNNK